MALIARTIYRSHCTGPHVHHFHVGESHPQCRISDSLVEQIRNHHDAGLGWVKIYELLLAQGVQIGKNGVRKICYFQRRKHQHEAEAAG